MFNNIFTMALLTAAITDAIDFLFHFFLTRPMESLTYFVIKFLLAFMVAVGLFSWRGYSQHSKNFLIIFIIGLIFSTLMSTYYRAWELGEARVPFGSRAPGIIGIERDSIMFSVVWWFGHALFFSVGAWLAGRMVKQK